MNAQEINHAKGLMDSLKRKAQTLRQQADDLDHDKEGRSRMATLLRQQADDLDRAVHALKAALDATVWLESAVWLEG